MNRGSHDGRVHWEHALAKVQMSLLLHTRSLTRAHAPQFISYRLHLTSLLSILKRIQYSRRTAILITEAKDKLNKTFKKLTC